MVKKVMWQEKERLSLFHLIMDNITMILKSFVCETYKKWDAHSIYNSYL